MTVNNGHLLVEEDVIPYESPDRDLFWYTELLTRETNRPAKFRLVRTFEHSSGKSLLERMPAIIELCENNNVRAYLRPSARSRRIVAHKTNMLISQHLLDGRYEEVKSAYSSTCGRNHVRAHQWWIYDVDYEQLVNLEKLKQCLNLAKVLWVEVPSKSGIHLLTKPHDTRNENFPGITIHKDNPTNLYVPDNAK